ncbi:hypothetical protein [Microvirga sp. M2]|uniref:hypothetical protein n=1 Tax=Microvirga sp. M2 TaxID=3073270 RepID=UPI0039C44DB7
MTLPNVDLMKAMPKDFAIEAKCLTLEALQKLHAIAALETDWTSQDMQELRRALGKFIGLIDAQILCAIYKQFPDLNDLPEEEGSQKSS